LTWEKATLSGAKTVKVSGPFSTPVRLALFNKLANVVRVGSDDITLVKVLDVFVGVGVGDNDDVLGRPTVHPDIDKDATITSTRIATTFFFITRC
jgi:hypothetical protein